MATHSTVGGTWWDRTLFYVSGFIVCVIRGELSKYDYLIAQARLETDHFHSHWFKKQNNPWCMHRGPLTPRAEPTGVEADDGSVAVYKRGWLNPYAKAWLDRLDWDKAKGLQGEYATCRDYIADVCDANWFGDGAGAAGHASYVTAVASVWKNNVGPFAKLIGGHHSVFVIVFIVLLFGIIALVAWLLSRRKKKRRR